MESMEVEDYLGLLEKQQNLDLEILAIMNSRMKKNVRPYLEWELGITQCLHSQ